MPYYKHWTNEEVAWLKQTFVSSDVRVLISANNSDSLNPKRGRAHGHQDGGLRRAATLMHEKYPQQFLLPREAESNEAFLMRKTSLQGSGQPVKHIEAETEEQCAQRIANLFEVRVSFLWHSVEVFISLWYRISTNGSRITARTSANEEALYYKSYPLYNLIARKTRWTYIDASERIRVSVRANERSPIVQRKKTHLMK